jgi:hypothetical protein
MDMIQTMKSCAGLFAIVCLASGCAVQYTAMPGAGATGVSPAVVSDQIHYWWYARYRLEWPQGAEPDWPVDLLLADRVIKPVLQSHRNEISYWRFHRRAIRDEAGHQFSFIFYTGKKPQPQSTPR